MRRLVALLGLLLLLVGVLAVEPAPAGPVVAAPPSGHVVVSFRDAASAAGAASTPAARGARPVGPRALAVDATPSESKALARQPGVVAVETDALVHASALPNDPCLTSCSGTSQWYVHRVGAPVAWNTSRGTGVIIAVLDDGVDFTHPDLAPKYAREIDATPDTVLEGDPPMPVAVQKGTGKHGTSVAGIAAAATNEGAGVAGVGWDAGVLSVKVLDQKGDGRLSWVVDGIRQATEQGAQVINMSFAGTSSASFLAEAVNYAHDNGVVLVAAAGNDGSTARQFPASLTNVISVGASTKDDTLASFSNRASTVDVAAPGVGILAPVQGGGYNTSLNGTSFSSPIVAGLAALVRGGSPGTVEQRLRETSVPLGGFGGFGRVNIPLAPYPGFPGGAKVALGDLAGTPGDEIVTGAGAGGGPHVRTFGAKSTDPGASFFAYGSAFSGGVDVAVGDVVPGSPGDEIVTGAGPGGGPHVRVFDSNGAAMAGMEGGFFAYAPGFSGGVNVAAGDVVPESPGDEIITGAGPGGGPHVIVYRADGKLLRSFFAYAPGFSGGVDVAAGDVAPASPGDEIVTGAGPGGGPHVLVYGADSTVLRSFFAYSPGFPGGVRVSAGEIDASSGDEIVTGAGSGGGPHVLVYRPDGGALRSYFAFDLSFTGGVDVAARSGTVMASMLRSGSWVHPVP